MSDSILDLPSRLVIEDLSGTALAIDIFNILFELGGLFADLPDVPDDPERDSDEGQKAFTTDKRVDRTEYVLSSGMLYTLGRVIGYTTLGVFITSSL